MFKSNQIKSNQINKTAKILLILPIIFLLISCIKKNENGIDSGITPINAPFLKFNNFKISSSKSIPSEDIKNEISYIDNFYYKKSKLDSSNNSEDSALSNCLNSHLKYSVPSKNIITLGVKVDYLKACPEAINSSTGLTSTEIFTLKYFYQITTDNCDFSSLDGLSINSLSGGFKLATFCPEVYSYKQIGNFFYETKGTYLGSESHVQIYQADMNDLYEACEYSVNESTDKIIYGNCNFLSKTSIIASPQPSTLGDKLSNLKSTGLVSTATINTPFFSSGTITAIINDWNGVVTYSDSMTPPSYQFTQTGTGMVTTGSIPLPVSYQ